MSVERIVLPVYSNTPNEEGIEKLDSPKRSKKRERNHSKSKKNDEEMLEELESSSRKRDRNRSRGESTSKREMNDQFWKNLRANKEKKIVYENIEKTDEEKEKDEEISKKGGLRIEEIMAIVLHIDSIQTLIDLRFVSKHVFNAIDKMKTNPYYSERKLNKLVDIKARIVDARKDILMFKHLEEFKAQLETIETIKSDQLLKYKSLKIINDGCQVDHGIYKDVKHIIEDLTIVLYPETQVNFEGLNSLKILRFDFNINNVSVFENFLKKGFYELQKNETLKELYIQCDGKYSQTLGLYLAKYGGKLIKRLQIFIRFENLTDQDFKELYKFQMNTVLLVSKNDLTQAVSHNKVKLIPDKNGVYHISNNLSTNKKYLKQFTQEYYPIKMQISGMNEDASNKKLNLRYVTTIESITLKDCSFIQPCKIKLPKQIEVFIINGADNLICPSFKESVIKQMEIISCNQYSSISLPTTVTSFKLEKCLAIKNIDIKEETLMKKLEINGCPRLEEIFIPKSVEEIRIFDCRGLIEIKNMQQGEAKELYLKYCVQLVSFAPPTTLTKMEVNNCDELKEIINFSSIGLKEFQSNGRFDINEKDFPTTLETLKLEEFSSKGKTIKNLSSLNQLKELRITESSTIEELSFPSSITTIELIGCHQLHEYINMMELKLNYLEISQSDALTRLSFPTSLNKVVIQKCKNMESIPNLKEISGLKELKIDECSSLQSLTLPTSLTKIDITKCKNLTEIPNIHELQIRFRDLLPYYYNLKQPLVPLSLSKLKAQGWNCEEIKNLNQLSIIDLQFINCSYLTNIDCPSTVTYLELNGCRGISKINNLEKLNVEMLKIAYCSSIKTLKLPKKLSKLVMYDNTNIQLDKLKKIPLKVLYLDSMEHLKSIEIPSVLTRLQIKDCENIVSIEGLSKAPILELHLVNFEKLKSLTIPTTVTKLYLDSFKQLNSIDNLDKLPLKELQLSGFDNLKKFKIPKEVTKFEFSCCDKVKSLTNLQSLEILDLTIYKMESLKQLELPTTLTKLKLQECNVLEIGKLDGFTNMKSLEINKCDGIKTITLPTTITDLKIVECPTIKQINNLAELQIDSSQLLDMSFILEHPIIKPEMIANTDKQKRFEMKQWKCQQLDIKKGIEIEKLIIQQCDQLTSLKFENKINSFEIIDCSVLDEMKLEDDNMETIIIKNCPKLKTYTLPKQIQMIRLENCNEITEMNLKEFNELTRIELINCKKIKMLEIGTNIKTLIVDNCDNIIEVKGLKESICEEINISKCDIIESISPPLCVEKITIENCYSLHKIEDFDKLEKLSKTNIAFLKKIIKN